MTSQCFPYKMYEARGDRDKRAEERCAITTAQEILKEPFRAAGAHVCRGEMRTLSLPWYRRAAGC